MRVKNLKLFLRIVLFVIVLAIAVPATIIGSIFILENTNLSIKTIDSIIIWLSVAVMALLYWLFFGKQQLKKRRMIQEQEKEIMTRMPSVFQEISEQGANDRETALFEIQTDYGPKDFEKATLSLAFSMKGFFLSSLILFVFLVVALLFMSYVTKSWDTLKTIGYILLIIAAMCPLIVISAKYQTKKNPKSGKITYKLYDSNFYYQITSPMGKTEVTLPYIYVQRITRAKWGYLILTKNKVNYFIPLRDSFDAEHFDRLLLERFPGKVNIKVQKNKTSGE